MFTTTKDAPKFMGFKGRTTEGVSLSGTDAPVPSFSWQLGKLQICLFFFAAAVNLMSFLYVLIDAESKPQKIIPPRGKPKRTAAQLRDGITRRRIHKRSLMTVFMALPLDLIYEVGGLRVYRYSKPTVPRVALVSIDFRTFASARSLEGGSHKQTPPVLPHEQGKCLSTYSP